MRKSIWTEEVKNKEGEEGKLGITKDNIWHSLKALRCCAEILCQYVCHLPEMLKNWHVISIVSTSMIKFSLINQLFCLPAL